jgi:phosphatidylinositol glycan class U
MHFELFKYASHMYIAIIGLTYSSVLGPLFFNSWVYNGGGNANFFYAITLVWAISQIVLIVDLVYAHLRREFEREHPGWRRMRVELLYQYSH